MGRRPVKHCGQIPPSQSIGASERRAKQSAGSVSRDRLCVPLAQPRHAHCCSFTARAVPYGTADTFDSGGS
jgi:hypothetical protein